MKKVSSIILVMVLLILPIMSFSSCEKEELMTIVGEIKYVKTCNEHCLYIKPIDQSDDGIWIPIIVSRETQTKSSFSTNLSDMPELAVGTIVEVIYNASLPKANDAYVHKFNAKSLKVVDDAYTAEKQSLPFKLTNGYEYTMHKTVGKRDFGMVLHVARITEPANGYIIYLEDNRMDNNQVLTMYWLDEDALYRTDSERISITDELRDRITSGETGYVIAICGLEHYPFDSIDIQSVLGVSYYDPNYHW